MHHCKQPIRKVYGKLNAWAPSWVHSIGNLATIRASTLWEKIMTLLQLRILQATFDHDFNLTAAAAALHTSQSGLSKHIRDLEDELGAQLFVRHGKRFLGLTEAGEAVLGLTRRILLDCANVQHIARDFCEPGHGTLRIATTHTQARYRLPPMVQQFRQRWPQVQLHLHQGSPAEVRDMVRHGHVDIGIATEALTACPDLHSWPFYQWQHCLVVPPVHPLTRLATISLDDIVQWPLITYHDGLTGRSSINDAFARAHLSPHIALAALDADVIKTYTALGLGVGIIAGPAFDATQDHHLVALYGDWFGEQTTWLSVRRQHLLRGFAHDFIHLCCPDAKLETT